MDDVHRRSLSISLYLYRFAASSSANEVRGAHSSSSSWRLRAGSSGTTSADSTAYRGCAAGRVRVDLRSGALGVSRGVKTKRRSLPETQGDSPPVSDRLPSRPREYEIDQAGALW